MQNNPLEKEATLFCRYLIKQTPTDFVKELYARALDQQVALNDSDKKILKFALDHTWSLRFLDAGAAIIKPQSELRKRLYIMFAILESSPNYVDCFLTIDRSVFYLFKIIFSGIRAIISTIVGIMLIKLID